MPNKSENIFSRRHIFSSLFWKYLECTGTQGIRFVIQIILARLLLPADFGIVALMMVFISLAQVFVQSGFSTALIQSQDATDIDFSSVFYLSLGVAGVLYVLLYFAAPGIAAFYKMSELTPVMRVFSVILFFGAVNSIQNAVISREFKFKKLFYSSLGAVSGSGVIGIYMAYEGFGIWALVWQQIANSVFLCAIMWITVKWRPKWIFSLERVRILFSFGWKLLASGLLNTLYVNMQSLVIGKMFLPETLGFYNRGYMFPQVIVGNIDGAIQSVMFPAYSREQENRQRLKQLVRRSITTSAFVIFPLIAGLIATATPVVRIVLTDKWLPCVPYLQICCFSFALMPIHTTNLQAINAMGRSDIFLRLEIIKKGYGLIILAIAVVYFRSVIAIAWSGVFSGLIESFVNAQPNKKLLDYGYLEQLKDLVPSFLIASIMGIIVSLVQYIGLGIYLTLIVQVFLGIFVYVIMAKIFKLECFEYILAIIRTGAKKFRRKSEGSDLHI